MKVTDVSLYAGITPEAEEVVSFTLRDLDSSAQYMVRNILGLDSEELIPRFYGFGLQTRQRFYDFAMKARDIVIRLILNPRFNLDESYSDVRDNLYRAISSVRNGLIVLHFNSGGTTVSRIYGFITKFEVEYFNKLPEVQISITCPDPMFRAINPVIYDSSELSTSNPVNISDSSSTAPHGFQMQLTFNANIPSFTIQDEPTDPEWLFKVIPSGGFLSGDVLHFSSEYGNKYLYITRSGTDIYLIDKIQPDSIWPILFPGVTTFEFVNIASFDWDSIEYYAAYWGV